MKEFLHYIFHMNIFGMELLFHRSTTEDWHLHLSLTVSENITIDILDSLIRCKICNPEEDMEFYDLVARAAGTRRTHV